MSQYPYDYRQFMLTIPQARALLEEVKKHKPKSWMRSAPLRRAVENLEEFLEMDRIETSYRSVVWGNEVPTIVDTAKGVVVRRVEEVVE